MSKVKTYFDPNTAEEGDIYPHPELHSIVAVLGYANDWAAYAGDQLSPASGIAANGDKVSRPLAIALFPEIASRYQYRG